MAETLQERLSAAIGDRYDVLQRVGAGGMASVFLARHRLHGGFCAVKVLSERLSEDPALVKSFFQEARASAALDGHPNIVSIVDIAEAGGVYYLIMKYVEGEDLSSYVKRKGALRWKEAAYVIDKVAEALSWAHARGVVHRDLKPSNIRLGPHGRVTVLDFGIAKVGATPSTFTEMGARAGTPHYMAPEQIRGHKTDLRSDLYSLGVIGYELVAGRRPFEGENREAIWFAHVSEAPPSLEEAAPKCPEPLRHIINRLLEKEPEKRYQSAEKVVEHLRRLGASVAPESLQPRSSDDLEKWRQAAAAADNFTPPTPTSRSSSTQAFPTTATRTTTGAHPQTQPTRTQPTGTHTGTQPKPLPTFPSRDVAAEPSYGANVSDRSFRTVGADDSSGSKLPLMIAAAFAALLLGVAIIFFAFRASDAPTPQPAEVQTPAGDPGADVPSGSSATGAQPPQGSSSGAAANPPGPAETATPSAPPPTPPVVRTPPANPPVKPPPAKKTGPSEAERERAKEFLRGGGSGGAAQPQEPKK